MIVTLADCQRRSCLHVQLWVLKLICGWFGFIRLVPCHGAIGVYHYLFRVWRDVSLTMLFYLLCVYNEWLVTRRSRSSLELCCQCPCCYISISMLNLSILRRKTSITLLLILAMMARLLRLGFVAAARQDIRGTLPRQISTWCWSGLACVYLYMQLRQIPKQPAVSH